MTLTPNTTYVVEHFGCGCDTAALTSNDTALEIWKEALHATAQLPNVACFQLGGVMASFATQADVDPAAIKPLLVAAVTEFGCVRACVRVCE
jgi:hypothetical protein